MNQAIQDLLEAAYNEIDALDAERTAGQVGWKWVNSDFEANDAKRAEVMKRIGVLKSGRLPSDIPLDNSVPTPSKAVPVSYPISDMAIGQSFIVCGDVPITNAHNAFSRFKRSRPGFNYTSQRQSDGSRRFWRTA